MSPFIILQVISFAFLAEDYKLIFVGVESKVIKVGLAVKKEEIFITYLTILFDLSIFLSLIAQSIF